MILGILMVLVGAALIFWLGKRAFDRRNQAGIETFKGFGSAVATRAGERILLIIGRLLIVFGAIITFFVWWVGKS